jgi:outer membrane autotransporter protein
MDKDTYGDILLSGSQGVSLIYDFSLDNAGSLEVTGARANPRIKALSEGFLGSLALVNQGADHIAGAGMTRAVRAAEGGLAAFGSFAGGRSRYDTGSHVDVEGFSLLAGLAWGHDFSPGRLTLGAFFEYGNGDYDTHNSFSNAASVRGDGETDYAGGGILGRFDFAPADSGNFYAEASGRAGKVDNEYDSSDLRAGGRKAEYDTSSAYYGFHAGAGYVWRISEAASLDLYGKYFWTRQEGDSLRLSTGDPVKFEDADSSRLRGGARLAYAVTEHVRPYIGAAYEHEFDGKARASTHGYSIKAPELEGGTGIGELGLTLTPSASLPLSFDLGAQGYTGTREGVSGSLQLRFEF